MYYIFHVIINLIWSIPNRKINKIAKLISILFLIILYFIMMTPLWILNRMKILINKREKTTYYKIKPKKYNKQSFNDDFS